MQDHRRGNPDVHKSANMEWVVLLQDDVDCLKQARLACTPGDSFQSENSAEQDSECLCTVSALPLRCPAELPIVKAPAAAMAVKNQPVRAPERLTQTHALTPGRTGESRIMPWGQQRRRRSVLLLLCRQTDLYLFGSTLASLSSRPSHPLNIQSMHSLP